MDWIKKHTDTVLILGAVISSVLWMNTKFNEVDARFSEVEKDLAVIKTVLVIKNVIPMELVTSTKEEK